MSEFSGQPPYALLQVIMPCMPLGTITLGLIGEIVALIHYVTGGYREEFLRTLILMIIPIVVLLLSTVLGIEKSKPDDPEVIKNNTVLRAFYYAFHIKIFHEYLRSVGSAALGLCSMATVDPDKQNPKNIYEATMVRRYLAFLGLAPQVVNQMNIMFNRVIQNGDITPEDAPVNFAICAMVISMGCSLAQHHCTDRIVDYDTHWSAPMRFIGTTFVFMWKCLLVTGRGVAVALFLNMFGILTIIPILLHGIIVFIIYMAGGKPVIDGFGGLLKSLILCYNQMYDMNDVYLNEVNGKAAVQFAYYIFRLLADISLVLPFFMLSTSASNYLKIVELIVVFGSFVAAIFTRIVYYKLCHPKWRENTVEAA